VVLTNGHDWIFLLIKLNDDYNGGSYMQSEILRLMTTKSNDGQLVISEEWPDLIAGILLHWVGLIVIHVIDLLTD